MTQYNITQESKQLLSVSYFQWYFSYTSIVLAEILKIINSAFRNIAGRWDTSTRAIMLVLFIYTKSFKNIYKYKILIIVSKYILWWPSYNIHIWFICIVVLITNILNLCAHIAATHFRKLKLHTNFKIQFLSIVHSKDHSYNKGLVTFLGNSRKLWTLYKFKTN